MTFLQILVLALVQGAAELLPVSSSAHVIVAEKLMGLDPTAPEMTFLLVMLHTGTMLAVILYFWKNWRDRLSASTGSRWHFIKMIALATIVTGALGLAIKILIEKVALRGYAHQEIEAIFGNIPLIAGALLAAALLILLSGYREWRQKTADSFSMNDAVWIGGVQGLCLPFRGFSRSGATISTALIRGLPKQLAEEYSFALAVVLTPPVIAREAHRLLKSGASGALIHGSLAQLFAPGLLGMVLAFGAGLLALRWLSSWLEKGNWKFFGIYCLLASTAILTAWRFDLFG